MFRIWVRVWIKGLGFAFHVSTYRAKMGLVQGLSVCTKILFHRGRLQIRANGVPLLFILKYLKIQGTPLALIEAYPSEKKFWYTLRAGV